MHFFLAILNCVNCLPWKYHQGLRGSRHLDSLNFTKTVWPRRISQDSNILAQSVEVIDYESPTLASMLNSGGDIKGIIASYVVQLRECMSATLTLKTSTSTCQSSIAAPWSLCKLGECRDACFPIWYRYVAVDSFPLV